MRNFIERTFKVRASGSSITTEIVAGFTTFLTLSYILFVQPIILSQAGMDSGAVFTATCLASAIACLFMAFTANYPIALAPAMGHNIYFMLVVTTHPDLTWQTVLGANMISGIAFLVLSLFRFREKIMTAVPEGLRHAIAVGIGLLIAYVGLVYAGIILPEGTMLVRLGDIGQPYAWSVLVAVLISGILLHRRSRFAILAGIAFVVLMGLLKGFVHPGDGIIATPPSLAPTFFKFDILAALSIGLLEVIFIFFFLDLFDTVGTLIGVAERGGFLDDRGRLPRAGRALLSDAVGTVVGVSLGTSTITSYVESAAGVSAGGRTGLANVATALCFFLALFFSPVAQLVGGAFQVEGVAFVTPDGQFIQSPRYLYPAIAPALICIGVLIMAPVRKIKWEDMTEAVPAFLCIVLMAMSISITDGIAFGFIAYTVLKAGTGRFREVSPLVSILSVLFLIRFLFLK